MADHKAARGIAAAALLKDPVDRREKLLASADQLKEEMERLSDEVRILILAQPPIKLLGYLMGQFHIVIMSGVREAGDEYRPDKEAIKTFQLALEYAHAVWSCHADLVDEIVALDENRAGELFKVLDELATTTMFYCMASSAANADPGRGPRSADVEFHAKTSWTLIRGHRYQVLEAEFFRFVLAPHEDALRTAYGMGADEIAAGIQGIADAMRTGFSTATERMMDGMERAEREIARSGDDMEVVLGRLAADDPDFTDGMSGIYKDMFLGGICNLSRHTALTAPLLEDLSFAPGENTEFFAAGEFRGTPMRTLPGRVKPAIRLGGEVYATDGQFVRDSAYRAIQRGIAQRLPYRDEWLTRQGVLVEQAFPTIFARQMVGARSFESVYFKDVHTGQWVETDLVVVIGDALLVIEAKAGNMPMQSPATSFRTHERVIQDLVVKAYRQCRRFVDYLASAPEVLLFALRDGHHVEVGRLRQHDFRIVLPIGLTVEAFTPFSAMAKELPEVEPLLGHHPFISMSVDDLFVLNRFLPTTGMLLHYLEVRQQAAGIRGAMLFDEIDHLGIYISENRFDVTMREHLEKADRLTLDGFSDVVDRHFEGPDWDTKPVPTQVIPLGLEAVLDALDRNRTAGWLQMDAFLRDFDGAGRNNLAGQITLLEPTLREHPRRRLQIGEDRPLQVWLCRAGAEPSFEERRDRAETGCLVVGATEMLVLVLSYHRKGEIGLAACWTYRAPTMLQTNYAALQAEANYQRGRMKRLDGPPRPKKRRERRKRQKS